MKDFLLLYEGGDPDWMEKWPPERIQSTMAQWGAWFQELEASGNLRNPGAALEPGGAVLTATGNGVLTDHSLPELKELIGGFTVIAASSIEEAAELAKGSPHLQGDTGSTVLVRPVLQPEG